MAAESQQFHYRAYATNGAKESGIIEASDLGEAARKLSRMGKTPFELKPSKGKAAGTRSTSLSGLFQKELDLTRFFSDLSVMLNAGFNVDIALGAVANAETDRRQKARIQQIHTRISEGKSVAEAFSSQPEIPADVVALVASGENSGQMASVFAELAKNFKRRAERRSEVLEAVLYPAFLIVVLFGTLLLLSVYLVPSIEPIFENGGAEKPLVVNVLSGLGSFVSEFWLPALIVIALCGLLLVPLLRSQSFKIGLNNILLKLPLAGTIIFQTTRARYLHSMALLLSNGVPLHDAMQLSSVGAPVEKHRVGLEKAREEVTGGLQLWKALENSSVFDDSLVSLVKLGEESNNLAPIMERAAVMTETMMQRSISRILTFLTPAITIFLGLVVGTLVISVMTALLSINEIAIR
ncbi:MAG: type II secretion system F family protein [Rhizobiaceae bacterium]|nr:type II secretion system F family protein [Rhizobiaceae bacterium]